MAASDSQTFLRELDKTRAERDRVPSRAASRVDAGTFVHHGTIGDIMVFGQESNPTTWRLTAMNMAKSLPRRSETATGGIDFRKEPADTFTRDQHPDLRADFVIAPPGAAARSLPRSHPGDRPNGRIKPTFQHQNGGTTRWRMTPAGPRE